jgi:hypothetical protein
MKGEAMTSKSMLAPSHEGEGDALLAMPENPPQERDSLLTHPEFEDLHDFYGELSAFEEKEMFDNLSGFFSILSEWQENDVNNPLKNEEVITHDEPTPAPKRRQKKAV